ncbi:uncharacterized protein LOC131684155 isoform X4 [Topomyia yanbarensis]|uniref:uncharacterized protein LOC131684155 isoform X4 n=2 Tax=Topomyia yanbarensis TaxID=2498891 RepID=UPI00273CA133|nr:uncharacterized protein LOC131684155 isoform X4 [Topomyia yanbarensis]
MDSREGRSTATTVYRILQSPAPICMFYFAHPFGISSPAVESSPGKTVTTRPPESESCRKPVPLPASKCEQEPVKTTMENSVRQRPLDELKRIPNGVTMCCGRPAAKPIKPENRTKSKKNKHSSTGTGLIAKTEAEVLSVKPHAKSVKRVNLIELDSRQTPLTPWPSTIWNRDFLIPPLLQVLAKQHGRKIPDIEQILRTVRTAWNTPRSQRSLLQSQDSRDSSSSNWDLSSSCDSYYCGQGRYHGSRMGAGTYAMVMGSGPGLLRRRYSVPEIIMRKHTLAQQKSYEEPCDSNHNNTSTSNKNCYPSQYHTQYPQQPQTVTRGGGGGGRPMTRASSKETPAVVACQKQQPQSPPVLVHRKSIMRTANSVESAPNSNGNNFNMTTLASTGSESNLATMKRQPSLGGISRSQKSSSVIGINSSNNNNYIGPVGSTGVSGVGSGALGGCGVGGATADFSMRKSTLLRRMWSKEMRRYDRSGSWSPPLRRAPRRIYSIESIIPPEGLGGSGGGSGASSEGGSCVTTTTTSCKECAKLENQYNSIARSGKLAEESPKRLRLATSLNNVNNNNLQKGDGVEGLSRVSTPGRILVSSEGDSVSLITKSSKPEVSSSTETASTPLLRHKDLVVNDRSKRNFVFMNAGPNTPSTANDVELEEADLSSSTSSIASQACARPVGHTGCTGTILEASEEGTLIDNEQEVNKDDTSTILNAQDNESDLSEFLKEEAFARHDDNENCREAATERGGDTDANVHPRECAQTVGGGAPSGSIAVKVSEKQLNEEHFPLKKQIARRSSDASSSAVSISTGSTDSESSDNVANLDSVSEKNRLAVLTRSDILKNEEHLDEYISNLLVDNLNNLLQTNEVFASSVAISRVSADQKNNNKLTLDEVQSIDPVDNRPTQVNEMKQKLPEKYINGGGGVVCNSPPQPGNKHHQSKLDKECEKENQDTMNNNHHESGAKISFNYIRKKNGERQHNINGFYLVPKNNSRESDGVPSEIDLNGKYYFPTYGIETDPSDYTDIASEPEVQIISKIGTGSTYRGNAHSRSVIVSRMSAFPRTESMEVQPSSTSAEEEFEELAGNNGSESDTPSLVDSLDEVEITPRRRHDRKKSSAVAKPAPAAEVATKSESISSDKSPRHEKGEAFFVPIQDTAVILDDNIVVADAMPLLIKERLNSRHRLMIWRREQENLEKHRKMMRLIEQKKFYGEPAIQVISTIDRALGRKEHIAPEDKKRVFGQSLAKLPKGKKKGNVMRTELGMLESYKIDARGNMQIQNPAGGSSGSTSSTKKVAKSPWGQAAERRQTKTIVEVPPVQTSTKSSVQSATATTSVSSKTPRKTPVDPRRKQVLKDVQQMTLYQQADLTPDIEGGPRRMYQKTEIQEGDKHIEILEIVECGDSATGNTPRRMPRVKSAGSRSGHIRSRIPVPIYRWGRYRRSNISRENSPLSTGGNKPKVDRMIADLLLEAMTNPDDVGVKFIKSPEELKEKSKRSAGNRKNNTTNSGTPKRSANSGRYTQRFEMIPEERSSVSVGSSSEELSAGRKKNSSPRRVSFDEHHKILNVDELKPDASKLAPKVISPRPSPKQSPKKVTPTPSPGPKAPALKKNNTTSRGKAAIQSDVVEEKGWIGFTTQHEDTATPVNGDKDEDVFCSPVAANKALAIDGHHHRSNLADTPKHGRRSIVKTITTGNIARHQDTSTHQHHLVDHFHRHQRVNISVNHDSVPVALTGGSVISVNHVRSAVATVGSNSSCNGTVGEPDLNSLHACTLNQLAITTTPGNRKLTSSEFSDDSCFTDSLNAPKLDIHELAVPEQLERELRSAQYGGHCINELKSTAESVKEIREENAWHVYETVDCKVFQSKVEYFETSIHRTPLTENHQSLFGHLNECTPESLRSAILKSNFDNQELVRHDLLADDRTNLTSSDTLDYHHIPVISTIGASAINEEAPKTSETCSSCCFCNPELHKNSCKSSANCFYCQAKSQSPSKSFPNPPTPPNIQMSPIPPSPKTPIMELTPTPTLQEIPLPPKKAPQPEKPQKPQETPKPPPITPKASKKLATETSIEISTSPTSINGLYKETTKKTDHTHTKTKSKASDTVSTKCTTSNEKIKRSYVPSTTADSDKLEEVSKKLTRKKSETSVLNRPKNINNLNRNSAIVHSVQKEIKNELKTPIKVLPKTAKELNNRKERDKQIDLNLPLDPPPKKHEKSKTTLGFENFVKTKPTLCVSSQSYEESTSSSSTDTSPNSSPFKKCAVLPPAARWKHNSERNLTQLTMQKIATASKWGNKWRKAARQHEHSPAPAGYEPENPISPARPSRHGEPQCGKPTDGSNVTSGTTASAVTAASSAAIVPSTVGGISHSTTTNQGWTVTVAGNYNPDMAPDVEMRLSFPKQTNGGSAGKAPLVNSIAQGSGSGSIGSKRTDNHSAVNGHESSYQSNSLAGSRKQYAEEAHHIAARGGPNYALLDSDSYGISQSSARAALPHAAGLNPKRSLSRSDGIAASKDNRLPNVGTSTNVPARQNGKKAVKQTVECSVVTSATSRTIANKYHMLSHQHQLSHEQTRHQQPYPHQINPSSSYNHQQQQHHPHTVGPPPGTTTTTTASMNGGGGKRGGRQRAISIQSLHHTSLQNGGGGKFLSSNSHQTRYHDPSAVDYGSNVHQTGNRRMSLESIYSGPHLDHLSVMGNAIAPEHKPKVPTMSERDLTRKHHPCYVRTQPYFS